MSRIRKKDQEPRIVIFILTFNLIFYFAINYNNNNFKMLFDIFHAQLTNVIVDWPICLTLFSVGLSCFASPSVFYRCTPTPSSSHIITLTHLYEMNSSCTAVHSHVSERVTHRHIHNTILAGQLQSPLLSLEPCINNDHFSPMKNPIVTWCH